MSDERAEILNGTIADVTRDRDAWKDAAGVALLEIETLRTALRAIELACAAKPLVNWPHRSLMEAVGEAHRVAAHALRPK